MFDNDGRIFKTIAEIETFAVQLLDKNSGINWDKVSEYNNEQITEMLEDANADVDALERAYNRLTEDQDESLAIATDAIAVLLAQTYGARHTMQTVLSVRETVG